jgi:hypothetical protein
MIDGIRRAQRAHEVLRSERPTAANLPAKAEGYQGMKELFDELWAAAGEAAHPVEVRRVIRLLTVDAEYFAGLSDSEGFRDPTEAWSQYELLERAFG